MIALLVDEDFDTRHTLAEYLRLGSWTIHETDDGRDALALAIKYRPSVIVAESRLRGIDGIELCRLLRRDETTESIPILILTADALSASQLGAREAGADAVLPKPCGPDRLAAEIERVLRGSAERRSHEAHVRKRQARQPATAAAHVPHSRSGARRVSLKLSHLRRDTLAPPVPPPSLNCPVCDRPLTYDHSHVGGVSERNSEQWDYFFCSAGCGRFQHRVRTRRLRRVW